MTEAYKAGQQARENGRPFADYLGLGRDDAYTSDWCRGYEAAMGPAPEAVEVTTHG